MWICSRFAVDLFQIAADLIPKPYLRIIYFPSFLLLLMDIFFSVLLKEKVC